jgi:hypothetical protein
MSRLSTCRECRLCLSCWLRRSLYFQDRSHRSVLTTYVMTCVGTSGMCVARSHGLEHPPLGDWPLGQSFTTQFDWNAHPILALADDFTMQHKCLPRTRARTTGQKPHEHGVFNCFFVGSASFASPRFQPSCVTGSDGCPHLRQKLDCQARRCSQFDCCYSYYLFVGAFRRGVLQK